jgi:hypothetical protein
MTTAIEGDLNGVITAAVNARVEAAVMEALAGDATIGRLVVAALQQPVEVAKSDGYGKVRVPFLNHLMSATIREAAKQAVARVLVEEQQAIEEEVRKHIRRSAPEIAAKMAGQLVEASSKSYGVSVTLRLPGE